MYFKNALYRGNNFLDTYNDNDHLITPKYAKGGSWLSIIGMSNSICTQATRLITNHAPISEYRARFFSSKGISCFYSSTQLEIHHHILCKCLLYSSYNRVGYVFSLIIDFLQCNPRVFCFLNNIGWLQSKNPLPPLHLMFIPQIFLLLSMSIPLLCSLIFKYNHLPWTAIEHCVTNCWYKKKKY